MDTSKVQKLMSKWFKKSEDLQRSMVPQMRTREQKAVAQREAMIYERCASELKAVLDQGTVCDVSGVKII